jgi:hypothetical protein
MTSFFHIFLKPGDDVSNTQVKEKMNLAIDWYKYSDYCWVLKSTSTAQKWQTRLKPLVQNGGSLLILKLDLSDRQGWLSKDFWKWLKDSEIQVQKEDGSD